MQKSEGARPELSGVRNAGYSLLETMIASAISIIVFAGFFAIFGQFQIWSSNLNLLLERDANLWLAPLLFSRWITPTGNNRWDSSWSGVTVQADHIELNSDIHGPGGFPDSQLSSSFEALVIRSSRFNLQVKSGTGSFQPVMKNITDFQVDSRDLPLISILLSSATDRPLLATQENLPQSTRFLFFLRNYRANLFLENL